jgi:hypothetical protein
MLTDLAAKTAEVTAIVDAAKQKEAELNIHQSRIHELKTASESNTDLISQMFKAVNDAKQAIDIITTDIGGKHTEVATYYNHFIELRQKIESPEEGLSQSIQKAGEAISAITKVGIESNTIRDEALANKIKTDSALADSLKAKEDTLRELGESLRLRLEIGKILDLVRDTGLANSFDRRRKRSQKSIIIGVSVILVGAVVSWILIHNIFLTVEGQELFKTIDNDYIKFLLRVTLTAPGVFIVWFGATQYAKERYFLEQYEFKTAAALALENYTKLLRDNYKDKEGEIFSLSLELIRKVYKEPSYMKPKSGFFAKVKSGFGSLTAANGDTENANKSKG